jgi:formate/nitrite transporter FocA (FNT family)
MSFAAKTVGGKIIGLFFPIMLFVLCGFEHSVANMYYIPAGLFAANSEAFLNAAGKVDIGMLSWGNFFVRNLIPVTIGNVIGGGVFVAAIYWGVYLKGQKKG